MKRTTILVYGFLLLLSSSLFQINHSHFNATVLMQPITIFFFIILYYHISLTDIDVIVNALLFHIRIISVRCGVAYAVVIG